MSEKPNWRWTRVDIIAEPGTEIFNLYPDSDRLVIVVRQPDKPWPTCLAVPVDESKVIPIVHRCASIISDVSPLYKVPADAVPPPPPEILPLEPDAPVRMEDIGKS